MNRHGPRALRHEIQGLGGILALADTTRGGIAAPVGMFAGPAVVRFGKGRSRRGQSLGRIAWRFDGRSFVFGYRALIRGPLGQQGILFEFLLDESSQLKVRKLQQLDGLLKLWRHRQGLA